MFIIKYKKIFIGISLALVALSVFVISFFGLNFGIDFRGGTQFEVRYLENIPIKQKLIDDIKTLGVSDIQVFEIDSGYLVKTENINEEQRVKLEEKILLSKGELSTFSSIGPSVGRELTRKAFIALILVSLGIIFFITYAFRKVSEPVSSWKYGIIAICSLIHDVLIPTAIFVLISNYTGTEVDTLFVVAVLTVLGLSVSDTIVVFDRIRENLIKKISGEKFSETVGKSIGQVYVRSINTSLTTILALLALFFFGPESTRYFALMMSAGMFFGTYSSIFLASPLLVVWENYSRKKKEKSLVK